MARKHLSFRRSGMAVPAGVTTGLLGYLGPSNTRLAVYAFGFGAHSREGTDDPGLIEFYNATEAIGTGFPARKKDDSISESARGVPFWVIGPAIQEVTVWKGWRLHPQANAFIMYDREHELILSGTGSRSNLLRATFAQAQTVDAFFELEE